MHYDEPFQLVCTNWNNTSPHDDDVWDAANFSMIIKYGNDEMLCLGRTFVGIANTRMQYLNSDECSSTFQYHFTDDTCVV